MEGGGRIVDDKEKIKKLEKDIAVLYLQNSNTIYVLADIQCEIAKLKGEK
jgi:hypothetical protein